MDPTHKKHPKTTLFTTTSFSSAAATQPHHHPLPDPTIQSISKHFSKLNPHHKKLFSILPSNGHSQTLLAKSKLDTHFQAKSPSVPSVLDTSCTTLTKSKSQNQRNNGLVAQIKEKREKYKKSEIKKPSKIEPKKSSHDEDDFLKKSPSQLMPRSLENDEMKRFQEGYEIRRASISSALPVAVNGGGRRRSFCSSQTELADFLSCNGVKVVAADMPPFMQIHAVDCARKTHDSLEKFTSKTLAFTLKKEFDGVYGPAWHCIVGTGFGSFVTHSVGGFIYFSMDHKLYVLLFKTTVQRAD